MELFLDLPERCYHNLDEVIIEISICGPD